MLKQIVDKVLNGEKVTENDVEFLIKCNLKEVCKGADEIRKKLNGNKVDLCAIINGKSGKCGEDCKFCAQSAHNHTDIEAYDFLDKETITRDCIENFKSGVHRYSIVTAGRTLSDSDFEKALNVYAHIHNKCSINLCASHGLLTYEQLLMLKKSGVERYHCNLETSREFFSNICTTHTYDQKIEVIKNAKRVGLEVCSGGIIGMGETMEDRVSLAFTLAELNVDSIPINVLIPIPNTPLEDMKMLEEDEILRTFAIFRFINPRSEIRIAAGRKLVKNNGLEIFYSGANSTITGNYLTTTGSTISKDIKMFKDNGFELKENIL